MYSECLYSDVVSDIFFAHKFRGLIVLILACDVTNIP